MSDDFSGRLREHREWRWQRFGTFRLDGDGYRIYVTALPEVIIAYLGDEHVVMHVPEEVEVEGKDDEWQVFEDMAFLRALFDAVNDVSNISMVVVMIASDKDSMDLDEAGIRRRLELEDLLSRNGIPATINDSTDLAAILRRRLFDRSAPQEVFVATSGAFSRHMQGNWKSQVFDLLNARWVDQWDVEVQRCYPFHPQLITLAEQEWSQLAGYQRVRSTIRIFAATVFTLWERGRSGEWAPLLIGMGDLPLSANVVRESIIGSGLIADSRVQANYRQIAGTDIVGGGDQSGAARRIDLDRPKTPFSNSNPRAAERAATALFIYSIVGSRGAGHQGATAAELKASIFVPVADFGVADADSVIKELEDYEAGGLASLEPIPGKGGRIPRLFMSTRQTLNMLFRTARGTISDADRDEEVSTTAERLINTGAFRKQIFVRTDPNDPNKSLREILYNAGIDDARSTRLVVLDPRRFSLLNGSGQETMDAIRAALSLGNERLPVQRASSSVFAVINSSRRSQARGQAATFLAWKRVSEMTVVVTDPSLFDKASEEVRTARRNLESVVLRAFQHVVYLAEGSSDEPRIDRTLTLEHDGESSLNGQIVWKTLVESEKALDQGQLTAKALLHNLRIPDFARPLDEIRDMFWNSPRMPLLFDGERDLQ